MSDLVSGAVDVIAKGNFQLTRESMTPGGDGDGKMKSDKPCDIGTKKGKSKQPDETGQTGQTKPKSISDKSPK